MLSFKKFKELGGVPINGDCLRIGELLGSWSDADDAHFLLVSGAYDESSFESFAWRPMSTLPDKPRFEYEVSVIGARPNGWRPLLEQSAPSKPYDFDEHVSGVKPVFTQEMADRNELPPVGSKCVAYVDNDSEECEIVRFHQDDVCVIWDKFSDGCIDIISTTAWKFKPIDTRTPKQKAVDKAVLVVDGQSVMVTPVIRYVIEALYDAGMLK